MKSGWSRGRESVCMSELHGLHMVYIPYAPCVWRNPPPPFSRYFRFCVYTLCLGICIIRFLTRVRASTPLSPLVSRFSSLSHCTTLSLFSLPLPFATLSLFDLAAWADTHRFIYPLVFATRITSHYSRLYTGV